MTQKEALDILKCGHNVYLTGSAGSGKTYLLNSYITYLRSHHVSVGITASTGIAGTHIGGTTIHSWAGIGIRDHMNKKEIEDICKKNYLRNRFLTTRVLIVDEISMLHADRLDLVDTVLRTFHHTDIPFGGIQLVLCGDFFQLPPVTKGEEKTHFVTESRVWQEMPLEICYLDEQYRQNDRLFVRVLNDIRNNEVNEMTIEYLSERLHKEVTGYVAPTKLYTHNIDVDKVNMQQLEAIQGESHDYFMSSRGVPCVIDALRASCLAPGKLSLKIGAQVMFVKNNFEDGYVNGTVGEVIDFDIKDHPIVRTCDGKEITVKQASWEVGEEDNEKAAISQLPLRLAWAITVHKSQGMSLDAAEVDLSRSFIPGMGYVALSRVRSLGGLKLIGINNMALQINQTVADMDKELIHRSDTARKNFAGLSVTERKQKEEDFLYYLKRT